MTDPLFPSPTPFLSHFDVGDRDQRAIRRQPDRARAADARRRARDHRDLARKPAHYSTPARCSPVAPVSNAATSGTSSGSGSKPADLPHARARSSAGRDASTIVRISAVALPSSASRTAMLTADRTARVARSEEHTSELQSLMRISYAVFCLTTKNTHRNHEAHH